MSLLTRILNRQSPVGSTLPRNYWRIWVASGSATLGLSVSGVVAPLLAIDGFDASPLAVSTLLAAESLPWLLLGLAAGVWTDRWSKRRVLTWSFAARAVAFASIPVAWLLGILTFAQLVAVMFVSGVTSVFSTVASMAVLPAIVSRDQLVAANTRLSTVNTGASLVGEGGGGFLFHWIGGPLSFLAEAITSVIAVFATAGLNTPAKSEAASARHFGRELREGLRYTFGHSGFRAITLSNTVLNFGEAARYALLVPFLVQVLGVAPATVGLLFAVASLGGLAGAASAGWLSRALGSGNAWRTSLLVGAVLGTAVPLATPGTGLILFVVGSFGLAFFGAVSQVISGSARQAICPPEIIGRMSATSRMVTWGVIPFGALAGGVLGTYLGVRAGLWTAVAVAFAGWLLIMLSPLRTLRQIEDLEHLQVTRLS